MNILQVIYGIGAKDTQYRSKFKKKKLKRQHFQISSQSKYSKNRLNANSVSTYIVTTNESNIMASASIIKKIYCSIIVNKQNWHGDQLLNNFQHLKEIYLNQFIYF